MTRQFAPMRIDATVQVRRSDGSLGPAVPIRPRSHLSLRLVREGSSFAILPHEYQTTSRGDL